MFLRLFRAPELAFWVLAALALGAGLLVAHNLGSDPDRAVDIPGVAAVRPVTSSAAQDSARTLEALMPAGVSAGTDPVALAAWARDIEQAAQSGMDTRTQEGAPADDPLLAGFAGVISYAQTLQAQAGDPVAATAIRTQIGLHSSRLVALVSGMPAPELPSGSLDTFGQKSLEPSQPTAPQPEPPATPELDTPDLDPTRLAQILKGNS